MYPDEATLVETTAYLRHIAESSPQLARHIQVTEMERAWAVRTWMFDAVVAAAWSWDLHPADCDCLLEEVSDPVIRVQAVCLTLRRLLEVGTDADGLDSYRWTRDRDPTPLARNILDPATLSEGVVRAATERAAELEQRRRAKLAELARLMRL